MISTTDVPARRRSCWCLRATAGYLAIRWNGLRACSIVTCRRHGGGSDSRPAYPREAKQQCSTRDRPALQACGRVFSGWRGIRGEALVGPAGDAGGVWRCRLPARGSAVAPADHTGVAPCTLLSHRPEPPEPPGAFADAGGWAWVCSRLDGRPCRGRQDGRGRAKDTLRVAESSSGTSPRRFTHSRRCGSGQIPDGPAPRLRCSCRWRCGSSSPEGRRPPVRDPSPGAANP